MTANKLFNYYLQAVETEVSVQKLDKVQQYLADYKSCIILYTYDSVLMDIEMSEARTILPQVKQILEEGRFSVKTSVGDIYNKMQKLEL
jgi:hypothetical protein